jgi:hypothetical protein
LRTAWGTLILRKGTQMPAKTKTAKKTEFQPGEPMLVTIPALHRERAKSAATLPQPIRLDHMQRLLAKADEIGIPLPVLLNCSLEALCDALEAEACLTFPIGLRTVLPSEQ